MPTYLQQVVSAIQGLDPKKPQSLPAIKKYLNVTPNAYASINRAIRKGVDQGILIKKKGKYRLARRSDNHVREISRTVKEANPRSRIDFEGWLLGNVNKRPTQNYESDYLDGNLKGKMPFIRGKVYPLGANNASEARKACKERKKVYDTRQNKCVKSKRKEKTWKYKGEVGKTDKEKRVICRNHGKVYDTSTKRCRPRKSSRKTIAQKRVDCREKGLVYDSTLKNGKGGCRKSLRGRKSSRKTIAQKRLDCREKGLVYDRTLRNGKGGCRKSLRGRRKKRSAVVAAPEENLLGVGQVRDWLRTLEERTDEQVAEQVAEEWSWEDARVGDRIDVVMEAPFGGGPGEYRTFRNVIVEKYITGMGEQIIKVRSPLQFGARTGRISMSAVGEGFPIIRILRVVGEMQEEDDDEEQIVEQDNNARRTAAAKKVQRAIRKRSDKRKRTAAAKKVQRAIRKRSNKRKHITLVKKRSSGEGLCPADVRRRFFPDCGEGGLSLDVNKCCKEKKKIYRDLVRKHHPDRGGDAEEFKRLNECKTTDTCWLREDVLADIRSSKRKRPKRKSSRKKTKKLLEYGGTGEIPEFIKRGKRSGLRTSRKPIQLPFYRQPVSSRKRKVDTKGKKKSKRKCKHGELKNPVRLPSGRMRYCKLKKKKSAKKSRAKKKGKKRITTPTAHPIHGKKLKRELFGKLMKKQAAKKKKEQEARTYRSIDQKISKYAAILMEEYNKGRLTESTRRGYEYHIELPASRGESISAKDIVTVWIYYLKDMVVGMDSDFKLYEEFVPLDISFDYRLLFETSTWFRGLRFSDVIREHYETDAALLKKRILTARDEFGNSLLSWQIANARPDTAKILLEKFYDKEEALTKQNLEIQDDINKNNVLHLLIAKGYYKHSGEDIQFHKQDLDWLEFPIPYLPKTEDESSLLKMILDADKDNVLNTQKNKFGLTPMLIAYLRAEPVVIAIMENKYGKVNIDEMISQESDAAKKKILKLVKASYTKYYLKRRVWTSWFIQSKVEKLLTDITSFEGSPYMHVWSP